MEKTHANELKKKAFFGISIVMGEGRERKKATGMIASMTHRKMGNNKSTYEFIVLHRIPFVQ